MIDFQNAGYVELGRVDHGEVARQIDPLLIEGEQGYLAFKGMRDFVVAYLNTLIAHHVL